MWTAAGRVLFSNDGHSLQDVTPPQDAGQGVEGAAFVRGGFAWVLVRASEGPLYLQMTRNGGERWEQAQLSLIAPRWRITRARLSFADRRHGWVVISWQTTTVPFGQMWRTGDGGVTWVKLPRPPTYGRILFDSASHGVLIGGATETLFTVRLTRGNRGRRRGLLRRKLFQRSPRRAWRVCRPCPEGILPRGSALWMRCMDGWKFITRVMGSVRGSWRRQKMGARRIGCCCKGAGCLGGNSGRLARWSKAQARRPATVAVVISISVVRGGPRSLRAGGRGT